MRSQLAATLSHCVLGIALTPCDADPLLGLYTKQDEKLNLAIAKRENLIA